jgi:hypothetical protein
MNFNSTTSASYWQKIFIVTLTMVLLVILTVDSARSQSAGISPANQDRRRVSGISDRFPKDLFSVLKEELNLTDDQMATINSLISFDLEYAEHESHNFNGSMPWDSNDKETFLKKYNATAAKLHDSLGDEKFDDFCQWVSEIKMINRYVENSVYDPETVVLKIENESSYKTYKEKKYLEFKSSSDADDYFSTHEKALRLKIAYLINIYGDSGNEKQPVLQIKKENEEKLKQKDKSLNELKELFGK